MNTFLDLVKTGNRMFDLFKWRTPGNAPSTNSTVLQLEVTKKAAESLSTMSATVPALSKTDIPALSEKIGGLLVSDQFIAELSSAIGRPHLGESEETFVKRCKESLYALIDKHLSA